MALKWDDRHGSLDGGWLSGTCENTVAVVLTVGRVGAEVHRLEEELGGSFGLVVYAGTLQDPTAVLAQCRQFLSDDEMAEVSRALGFGG